jgi:predicted metal-dependent hydrolase
MTTLTVRRLLVDLDTPLPRHWCGDAFRSAFFNALSMSFPAGEQFFIDAVREGVKALPADEQARFAAESRGFVGQEATHRRLHALFNGHLARQGHANTWEGRIQARARRIAGADPRHAVAITAATEHFTAIFAEHLLATDAALDGAEGRIRTLWQWHAAEESEHRCTAYDLYTALGGDLTWRRRWMRIVSLFFATDLMRQTVRNLHHDGALLRWDTWRSAARFLFGSQGLVRQSWGPWRAYFGRDFHPSQLGGDRATRWLAEHASRYAVVGMPEP